MKKIGIADRLLLLGTGVLAAYQVAVGIEGLELLPIICYTVGFGALLVSGLLLMILGFEILGSPITVIVSTLIPLSLSLGLIVEYLPRFTGIYLVFSVAGFLIVAISRYTLHGKGAAMVLAPIHGIAGLLLFGLPIWLVLQGSLASGFVMVGIGGALMGVGGLLLSFLKAGRPILSQTAILSVLPALFFLTTTAFIYGFAQV
ncbi:MAG: hypothetical protein DWQ07_09885 [Chloroflexi bacterium]|nr:MAG: hypothetical protein DWQ07_09885 [Chloroflexota bacterium]MBL1192977.1 hypothetical protein [Chloroflexota bacterium]NOH10269.1 hypothetical protein [Chloroflexota bacterium]